MMETTKVKKFICNSEDLTPETKQLIMVMDNEMEREEVNKELVWAMADEMMQNIRK